MELDLIDIHRLIIEPATLEDIQQVYEIDKENFVYHWSLESFYNELKYKWSEFFVAKYKYAQRFTAELFCEVVGYIICWVFDKEAHITNLSVKRKFQNKKIGSKLLAYLINVLRQKNVEHVYLEVRERNFVAIKLYQKFGFKQIALRENFYPDGEHAIVMNLELNP